MRIVSLYSLFLIFIAFIQSQSQSQCSSVRIRREIRDLSQEERTRFVTAFANLVKSGNYTGMVEKHSRLYPQVHFTAYFLLFHRYFILDFEDRMRILLGDSFTLPYWDWSIDSQTPKSSVIFTKDYFGSVNSNDSTIADSPLFNLTFAFPRSHLVTRSGNFAPFVNYVIMKNVYMLTNQSLSQFSLALESGPHPAVHNQIGGDLAYHYSTNDLLFYLHHSFVDKLWDSWQNNQTDHFKLDQDAYNILGTSFNSTNITMDSTVPGYGLVKDIMNIDKLCYTYAKTSRKAFEISTDYNMTRVNASVLLTDDEIMRHHLDKEIVVATHLKTVKGVDEANRVGMKAFKWDSF